MNVDVLIQRLALALVTLEREVLQDEADRRLFRDWLALYRAQLARKDQDALGEARP